MTKRTVLALAAALLCFDPHAAEAQADRAPLAAPAQIAAPPSASKRLLIRRFMELTGLQRRIDTGSFLERHAFPGGAMWQSTAPEAQAVNVLARMSAGSAALQRAYERYRATYQREYEHHIDWEYTEAELAEIVAFLERPAGQHYLDGSWRMEAYVGTIVEELEEEIVREAMASMPD